MEKVLAPTERERQGGRLPASALRGRWQLEVEVNLELQIRQVLPAACITRQQQLATYIVGLVNIRQCFPQQHNANLVTYRVCQNFKFECVSGNAAMRFTHRALLPPFPHPLISLHTEVRGEELSLVPETN